MGVIQFPMPHDLRQMELKVLNGADPDSIRGIERLWIWRLNATKCEWQEQQRRFYEWLKDNQ